MTFDVETLRSRLAEKPSQKGTKAVFTPPEVGDFAEGSVLALDQTLTKTGWIYLVCNADGLHAIDGGRIEPQIPQTARGFEETYAKAMELERLLISQVVIPHLYLNDRRTYAPEAVVHEMPSVKGYRLESSLMAGREIRRVVGSRCPVLMLNRQSAYSTLVGAAASEKAQGTKVVNRLIPKSHRQVQAWNQDVHDAALVGLKYLHEKKRRGL